MPSEPHFSYLQTRDINNNKTQSVTQSPDDIKWVAGLKTKFCLLGSIFWKRGWQILFCKGLCMLSCFSSVQLFVTFWTVARQAPLPMGFSRQECWSRLPFPSPGDLLSPGEVKPTCPVWQGSLSLSHLGSPNTYDTHHILCSKFYSIWIV